LILKLGNTDFWVRFFPALFGAITIIIVWKAIEELKGGIYALLLGSCCILFSALLRLNILYQPNSFDVMAWTFIYFCIIKFINRENKKWIWLAAMAFAVAFLNKYNIAFQLMGLLRFSVDGFIAGIINMPAEKNFYNAGFILCSAFCFSVDSTQYLLAISKWFSGFEAHA